MSKRWPDITRGARAFDWLTVIAASVVALFTSPVRSVYDPTLIEGLDPSWRIGLHQVFLDDLVWGQDVVNTLGPLGFAAFPMLSQGHTAWISIFTFGLLHWAAAWVSIRVLKDHFGWAVSILGTYVLMVVAWVPIFEASLAAEAFAALFGVMCMRHLTRAADGVRAHVDDRFLGFTLGALASLMLLIKLSTGLQGIAVGGATLVALAWLDRSRGRALHLLGGWAAGGGLTYLVGWVLLGQPLSALPRYLSSALEMAGSYGEAMGVERPDPSWARNGAFALIALVAIAAFVRWNERSRLDRLFMVAPLAGFIFFGFKLGFVRADWQHIVPFFLGMGLVALPLLGRDRRVALAAVAVVASVAVGWASDEVNFSLSTALAPGDNLAQSWENTELLIRPGLRDQAVDEYTETARQRAGFSAETLNLLRGKRVHIDPVETSLLFTYRDDFEWGAVPVFQSYLAYTQHFDDINAEWLRNDDNAPEIILRSSWAIDRRSPAYESPEYLIEMYCRYRQVGEQIHGKGKRAVTYAILQRAPSRCGEIEELSRTETAVGSRITFPPKPCDGRYVWAIEGFESLGQQIRTAAFKDATYTVRHAQGRGWRLVPGTAAQWHLFPGGQFPPWIAPATAPGWVQVQSDSTRLTPSSIEVIYGCLPVPS